MLSGSHKRSNKSGGDQLRLLDAELVIPTDGQGGDARRHGNDQGVHDIPGCCRERWHAEDRLADSKPLGYVLLDERAPGEPDQGSNNQAKDGTDP